MTVKEEVIKIRLEREERHNREMERVRKQEEVYKARMDTIKQEVLSMLTEFDVKETDKGKFCVTVNDVKLYLEVDERQEFDSRDDSGRSTGTYAVVVIEGDDIPVEGFERGFANFLIRECLV
jgi:hypothetical protein